MSVLLTVIVTFFAGMGAGLGTGFAGMSAAAVISPMLITFLGMDPYMAVGIALSSDVLASAVSAYTYGKNKNLDVKNGLIMMVTVLLFTIFGSYVSSLVPSTTMGNFSVFMTFLLGIKFIVRPVMTTKEAMTQGICKKTCHTVCYLWYYNRFYLWLYRCRRWYDDASDPDIGSWLRTEDGCGNQCIYYDFYSVHRCRISFCYWRYTRLVCMGSVRCFYISLGKNRSCICQ